MVANLNKLYAVARTTFTETVRQPIYAVIVGLTWLMLVMNVALSAFSLDDDNKLLQDLGLSTLLISGLMLSAFCASGVISGEIEDKTVLTVISKPVSRVIFLLGKFIGLNTALFMAYYLCSVVFLLTVRHKVMQTVRDEFDMPVIVFGVTAFTLAICIAAVGNFLYRWHFTSTALRLAVPFFTVALLLTCLIDKNWEIQPFGKDFSRHLIYALILLYFAVMMLSAVAVAASTRLAQVMTLVVCSGFFLLGLVSNYLFGRFADHSLLADLLWRAVGNLQPFWVADAVTQGHPVSLVYVAHAAAYGLLYTAAVLALAVALFQTREVG